MSDWKIHGENIKSYVGIYDADWKMVASIPKAGNPQYAKEQAEFIVTACNAYRPLVNALRALWEDCYRATSGEHSDLAEIDGSHIQAALEALRKAGEIIEAGEEI